MCGYCGRPERRLYAPVSAMLPYQTTVQTMAMRLQERQQQVAAHLRAVAELVASMPGGYLDITDEGLLRLTGMGITRDEQRMLVRLAVQLRPLATAPLQTPEYVPEGEG